VNLWPTATLPVSYYTNRVLPPSECYLLVPAMAPHGGLYQLAALTSNRRAFGYIKCNVYISMRER